MEKTKFITDSISGTKFPINGLIVSSKPSDLPKFGTMRTLSNQQLPSAVDLRRGMTPVEYQGQVNSCVGNVLAGAYEFLIMKNSNKHVDVSRLFIYYNARQIDGLEEFNMTDGGTSLTSGIKGLAKFGCCKEQLYPYSELHVNTKPPEKCYSEGRNYRVLSSMSINLDLNEMKACLAEEYPFAFGLHIYDSFEDAIHNGGRVMTPSPSETKPGAGNWHAMLAVGYDEASKCFIVRNSYGEQWGDKGYCYIPYDYMCNREFCVDLHAITNIEKHQYYHEEAKQAIPADWNKNTSSKSGDTSPKSIPHKFFWKLEKQVNYLHSIWQNLHFEDNTTNQQCFLWIDIKSDDNTYVASRLKRSTNMNAEFCETYSQGEKYILKNQEKIRSIKMFILICRGYYSKENKNPLDLIRLLIAKDLPNVYIFVFTSDKNGVQYHIDKQASPSELLECRQRLCLTDKTAELIARINQRMKNV